MREFPWFTLAWVEALLVAYAALALLVSGPAAGVASLVIGTCTNVIDRFWSTRRPRS